MIWDTFIFAGELDLLECRLRTMGGLDIRWIIAEAAWTFQGSPRQLSYPVSLARFTAWRDRITYLPLASMPDVTHLPLAYQMWAREGWQRGQLHRALNPAPGDVVLHSDVDEIPDPRVLAALGQPDEPVVLETAHHAFAVDWRRPAPAQSIAVLPPAAIRPDGGTLLDYRQACGTLPRIPAGGWHLSWLGGPAAIRAKVRAYSHVELTSLMDVNADRCYASGWCPWDGVQQDPVTDLGTLPDWITGRDCPASWFRPC